MPGSPMAPPVIPVYANPFNPLLPTSGLFATAGIPLLDNGVVSLSSDNSVYIKLIDLLFMAGGAIVLIIGLARKAVGLDIVGAILILLGILGVAVGWD